MKFYDQEEKDLITTYERAAARGELKPVKNEAKVKAEAVQMARRYLRKEARINIRLSTADLAMLKRKAADQGLPYQSLISSVLHKYAATGRTHRAPTTSSP